MSTPVSSAREIIDLLRHFIVRDVVGDFRQVISFRKTQPLSDVLRALASAKLRSAAILDETGICVGLLDMMDVVSFALECSSITGKSATMETWENLHFEGEIFAQESVGNVLGSTFPAIPFVPIHPILTLDHVVLEFAKEIPRLPVVANGQLVNVISHSDMLSFIIMRVASIIAPLQKSLVELGLGEETVQLNGDVTSTAEAIRILRKNRIHGLAVTNSNGSLIANFSATDLQGLNENNFNSLALPLSQFLALRGTGHPVVTCTSTSTLEAVILKMCLFQVHRVYIVGMDFKLCGVVSTSDIMKLLANELAGKQLKQLDDQVPPDRFVDCSCSA